jgi:uncharacterized protein involved in exopolysaccharide biosynthesis
MTRPSDSDDVTSTAVPPPAAPPAQRRPFNGTSPLSRPSYGRALPQRPARRQLPPGQGVRLFLMALVIVALGGSVGFAGSFLFPTEYAARAELVYLLGAEQPTGFLREDRNLTTQVLLLQSRSVLEPVAAANGLTVQELEEKLDVELVSGSEVLRLEIDDQSREVGQSLLTQIIERYTVVANDVAPADTRAYLESQLADVRARLTGPGLTAAERGALTERETALLSQVDSINLAGAQVKVVVPPYTAMDPVSPQPLLGLATGALVGLVVAGGVVLWQARRWTRG